MIIKSLSPQLAPRASPSSPSSSSEPSAPPGEIGGRLVMNPLPIPLWGAATKSSSSSDSTLPAGSSYESSPSESDMAVDEPPRRRSCYESKAALIASQILRLEHKRGSRAEELWLKLAKWSEPLDCWLATRPNKPSRRAELDLADHVYPPQPQPRSNISYKAP